MHRKTQCADSATFWQNISAISVIWEMPTFVDYMNDDVDCFRKITYYCGDYVLDFETG